MKLFSFFKKDKKARRAAIIDVSDANFEQQVIRRSYKSPVMVDFWAEWCSPCLSLAPALERVIKELEGVVHLAKVEVDVNMRLAGHYRLRGFPTVILFHQGEELGRFHGSRASHWLREWIEEHLEEYLSEVG